MALWSTIHLSTPRDIVEAIRWFLRNFAFTPCVHVDESAMVRAKVIKFYRQFIALYKPPETIISIVILVRNLLPTFFCVCDCWRVKMGDPKTNKVDVFGLALIRLFEAQEQAKRGEKSSVWFFGNKLKGVKPHKNTKCKPCLPTKIRWKWNIFVFFSNHTEMKRAQLHISYSTTTAAHTHATCEHTNTANERRKSPWFQNAN